MHTTTIKCYILSLLFFFTTQTGQSQDTKTIIDSLTLQLSRYEGTDSRKVDILNELSYQLTGSNYYEALKYAKQALELSQGISYLNGIAVAKNRLAGCYWIFGDSELGIKQTLDAIRIAEKEKLDFTLAESYRLLSVIYIDYQNNLDKAKDCADKAEKLAAATGNARILLRVYLAKAIIASRQGDHKTAKWYNRKCMELSTRKENQYYLANVYNNLGLIEIKEKPNSPSDHFAKALEMAIEHGNKFAEAWARMYVGADFLRKGQLDEAERYFMEGKKMAQTMGLKILQKQAYMELMNLYIKKGDFRNAHMQMQNYYALKDSLQNDRKLRQVAELEAKFEIDKKEQAIKILEQKKRIQIIWTTALLIISLIAGVAILVIYRLQVLRTLKAKELLEIQKSMNEKLKENDRLRTRFFANISHEFRTPLALILAPIEDKIARPELKKGDRDDFMLIKRNATRLLDLINQLLDLSKLEAGKMELNLADGNLKHFVSVLTASFESFAKNRGIRFQKAIDLPESCRFDADKIEKVIYNLLSNAFKFTPKDGTVTLLMETDEKGQNILLKVKDTGIGISAEDMEHIFSPFYQSKYDGEQAAGSGLGLALVRELVKVYGGEIKLNSKPREGTTVDIRIPLYESLQERIELLPATVSKINDAEGGLAEMTDSIDSEETLLVVEDNKDLRNFISNNFRNKFKVITATDGEQGFKLAVDLIPDLIISDVMMPKKDGIELIKSLKADERASHIPIILLTSKADHDSKMEGLEIGADEYMIKPFSPEELRVRVEAMVKSRKKLAEYYRNNAILPSDKAPAEVSEPSLNDRFILKLKNCIEQHISDPAFGVEKLSEEMCLSRTQLFRKVKTMLNTSPSDLISDIRLQQAAQLIRGQVDSITQICYRVGFNDHSYFAKRFRKKFGMSPTEFSSAFGIHQQQSDPDPIKS